MNSKSYIFDGKKYAVEKLTNLKKEIDKLKTEGKKLKLASIIVGSNPASKLYVGLKKKRGEEVGVEVNIVSISEKSAKDEVIEKIKFLNSDYSVNGIMIQLPLPNNFSPYYKKDIVNSINPKKDVDGLRGDSPYLHPTSKAVIEVLEYALNIVRPSSKESLLKMCVVGSTGMVGAPLVKELKKMILTSSLKNLNLLEVDSSTKDLIDKLKISDIVISTTGTPNLIKKDMVKEGVVLIDVGSPDGDIEKSAYEKASFVSPVPGGIGPITIACLIENLVNAPRIRTGP